MNKGHSDGDFTDHVQVLYVHGSIVCMKIIGQIADKHEGTDILLKIDLIQVLRYWQDRQVFKGGPVSGNRQFDLFVRRARIVEGNVDPLDFIWSRTRFNFVPAVHRVQKLLFEADVHERALMDIGLKEITARCSLDRLSLAGTFEETLLSQCHEVGILALAPSVEVHLRVVSW